MSDKEEKEKGGKSDSSSESEKERSDSEHEGGSGEKKERKEKKQGRSSYSGCDVKTFLVSSNFSVVMLFSFNTASVKLMALTLWLSVFSVEN